MFKSKADDVAQEEGKVLDEIIEETNRLPAKIIIGRYSKRTFDINNCGGKIITLHGKMLKFLKKELKS